MVDGFGVLVEGVDLATFAEEMDEVSSVAAAGVEDGASGLDVAAQDLVEDVDVDMAELFLDGDCDRPSVLQIDDRRWS